MSDDARSVGFSAVLRARLAGDAIADLTAAGPVIGEPIKLAKLRGKANLTDLASSLAVENLAYGVSACLMILTGTLSLLSFFALSDSLKKASWIAVALVGGILLLTFLIINMRWHLVSKLSAIFFSLFKISSQKLQRIEELETYAFDFYSKRTSDFLLLAACQFLFHFCGVLEIFVTLKLLGYESTIFVAFILEAVNRVINIVFAFVPAMVGVDEAGTGLLTTTLGLGIAAGVTLAIVRKARMLFWIGLGIIFLWQPHKNERLEK